MNPLKIRISNITYLRKPVKDYVKPFRFNLTILWEGTDGIDHGVDVLGCLGGVGRDGQAEWRGPMFWLGKRAAYSVLPAPGTYEKILRALQDGGYFKYRLQDVLPDQKPVPAEEEVGLPGALDV